MLNQVKNALENIIQLPAEIDKDAQERQVGVDFVRDEQIVDFENRAKSTQIKHLLKIHRQQVAFQALRHTYIDTNDADKRSSIEYFFSQKPDYKEANRLFRKMRDELTPEQKEVWKGQMKKIIGIMHPSLKIIVDDDDRCTAMVISLLVNEPILGFPIGDRGSIERQVREAIADIAPGYGQ